MSGVKERIKQIHKSYIKISDFEKIQLEDGITELSPYEDISIDPQTMGSLVECLTRYMLTGNKEEAFFEAIAGAKRGEEIGYKDTLKDARKLLRGIRGLGQASIENAKALLSFRNYLVYHPIIALYRVMAACTDKYILPEAAENARIYVNRSVSFFKSNGPVVKAGYMFLPGTPACGSGVPCGMIDFLTKDTLWDMKVYKCRLKSVEAQQVLVYWIMGQHSDEEIFKGIKKIGLYNPKANTAYVLDTSKISSDTIKAIENEVICYRAN